MNNDIRIKQHSMNKEIDISYFVGKTLSDIQVSEDVIIIKVLDGDTFIMYHDQDCCESVTVEDVVGEISNLIGSPITMAEETTNTASHPEGKTHEYEPESYTWTFYRLATVKGYVTIRWYGQSNGYYSESVRIEKQNS